MIWYSSCYVEFFNAARVWFNEIVNAPVIYYPAALTYPVILVTTLMLISTPSGLDRLRHFVCRLLPRRLIQPPADHVLLEAPPEPLAYAHALTGSSPS